jgi:hypothetical protein
MLPYYSILLKKPCGKLYDNTKKQGDKCALLRLLRFLATRLLEVLVFAKPSTFGGGPGEVLPVRGNRD